VIQLTLFYAYLVNVVNRQEVEETDAEDVIFYSTCICEHTGSTLIREAVVVARINTR
jgi:hypothetical protein